MMKRAATLADCARTVRARGYSYECLSNGRQGLWLFCCAFIDARREG